MIDRQIALDVAARHARGWLDSLATRPAPPQASVAEVAKALGTELPDGPTPADEVIELLATACDPGLTAMPGGRFYGMVIGGTHPAALAADWLVSTWDQNATLRLLTPAHSAVEDITSAWLLDLLGLPADSGVGFVTGATMSNFTCLAAARDAVLSRVGWDVATRRPDRGAARPRARRRRAPRHRGPGPALPRPRRAGAGRSRRPGPHQPGALANALDQIPTEPRPSSPCRRATCTPAPSTRSRRRSRPPTGMARGCTSTAPSACSPPPHRRPATSPRATSRPTPGPRTPTRPSTSRTTAASRSSPTARHCAPRWACTATTSFTTPRATHSRPCRKCRGAPAPSPSGRSCAPSAATVSPTWLNACARTPRRSRTGIAAIDGARDCQ